MKVLLNGKEIGNISYEVSVGDLVTINGTEYSVKQVSSTGIVVGKQLLLG